jgi:hypothetical protein
MLDALSLRAYVKVKHHALSTLSLNFEFECLETLLAASCDDNLCVRFCKAKCCCTTNSLCCSGDKDSLFHIMMFKTIFLVTNL